MKLNTKARYAVMALADLAHNDTQKPVPIKEISLRQGISIFYLEQLFSKLKKHNLVKSSRGVNGGYVLSYDPELIKLSNIISAVNEEVKTIKCNKKSKRGCNGKSVKCITHNLWDELENHINTFFNNKSLKDVLDINYKFEKVN